jgi:hypothetical protein
MQEHVHNAELTMQERKYERSLKRGMTRLRRWALRCKLDRKLKQHFYRTTRPNTHAAISRNDKATAMSRRRNKMTSSPLSKHHNIYESSSSSNMYYSFGEYRKLGYCFHALVLHCIANKMVKKLKINSKCMGHSRSEDSSIIALMNCDLLAQWFHSNSNDTSSSSSSSLTGENQSTPLSSSSSSSSCKLLNFKHCISSQFQTCHDDDKEDRCNKDNVMNAKIRHKMMRQSVKGSQLKYASSGSSYNAIDLTKPDDCDHDDYDDDDVDSGGGGGGYDDEDDEDEMKQREYRRILDCYNGDTLANVSLALSQVMSDLDGGDNEDDEDQELGLNKNYCRCCLIHHESHNELLLLGKSKGGFFDNNKSSGDISSSSSIYDDANLKQVQQVFVKLCERFPIIDTLVKLEGAQSFPNSTDKKKDGGKRLSLLPWLLKSPHLVYLILSYKKDEDLVIKQKVMVIFMYMYVHMCVCVCVFFFLIVCACVCA